MWPWSSAHCIVDVLDKQFSTVHNLPFWIQDFFGKTFAKKKHNLDPDQLKNYHPVLNLPFLSNLLEKVVLFQLPEHLNENKLMYTFQFAYHHGHSMETTLLHVSVTSS